MLIAIDHGNYAVKTPHFSFISGLTEHTVKPSMAEEFWSTTGNTGRSPGSACPI